MDDYRKELAEIEGLLSESRYEECSMKCGKRIELVLKHLAKVYLEKASETRGRSLRGKMRQGQPLERQSLGALAKLYKDEGILEALVDRQNPNHRELRTLDLDMIAHIRNKAAHDRQDDIDLEKSDALLLYSSLLKLLAITGLLDVQERGKTPVISTQEDRINSELVQHDAEKTEEPPASETKVFRPQKPRTAPAQPYEGKKVSQDALIPHIVRVLQKHGGRARKDEVEQEICQMFKDEFKKSWYQETLSNGVPRWQKNIAFAKERAKKKELIKPPRDSGRGCWELTDRGRKY